MNLVKVTYNKSLDACAEELVNSGVGYKEALDWLKNAKFAAYIYEPAHVNTDAYFQTEVKNKACIREYSKCTS